MRILIADDDAASRLLIEAMATQLGHECLVAKDSSSAWGLLSSEVIDILFTDWMTTGLDAPELCRRVRHEAGNPYVYIVLVTDLEHREQVLEGLCAGADDCLLKPVDPFILQTRLVAAARATTLHRQLVDLRGQIELANTELLERSLTDQLTGLGNRRRMEEDLSRAHAQAVRTGQAYGMTVFDIDHFKLYNDQYGHLAGDEVLRQVAWCLDATARAGEHIYRYGGEEFLLLLLDSNVDDAVAAAQRIRRAVTNMALPHKSRPTRPAVVTLSGGVVGWTPGSDSSVAELLHQADEALDRAKSAGRNCVQVATGNFSSDPTPMNIRAL